MLVFISWVLALFTSVRRHGFICISSDLSGHCYGTEMYLIRQIGARSGSSFRSRINKWQINTVMTRS